MKMSLRERIIMSTAPRVVNMFPEYDSEKIIGYIGYVNTLIKWIVTLAQTIALGWLFLYFLPETLGIGQEGINTLILLMIFMMMRRGTQKVKIE